MLLISISCGERVSNVSGIVLYPPLIYTASIAPPPHKHRLELGHYYTILLIFTYQLFRRQSGDLVFPALLHLPRGLYIEFLRYICTFATYMCRLDFNRLIAHIYIILKDVLLCRVIPVRCKCPLCPYQGPGHLYLHLLTFIQLYSHTGIVLGSLIPFRVTPDRCWVSPMSTLRAQLPVFASFGIDVVLIGYFYHLWEYSSH
jgi:hypothetical protein